MGADRSSAEYLRNEKISVSLPRGTVVAMREQVGRGAVSAFVAEAVAEKLRRAAMIDWLMETEPEFGEPASEFVDEAEAAFDHARQSKRGDGS